MHLNVLFNPNQDGRRLLATNSYTASHIIAKTGIASPARNPTRPRTEHVKITYANTAIKKIRPTPRATIPAPRSLLFTFTMRSPIAFTDEASQRKLIHASNVPSRIPPARAQPSGHATPNAQTAPAAMIIHSTRRTVLP